MSDYPPSHAEQLANFLATEPTAATCWCYVEFQRHGPAHTRHCDEITRLRIQLEAAERRAVTLVAEKQLLRDQVDAALSQLGRAREAVNDWQAGLSADVTMGRIATVLCPDCRGSGKGDSRLGCGTCGGDPAPASPPTTGVPTRDSDSGSIPTTGFALPAPAERSKP